MRDPNRIEPFMKELTDIWKTSCPNWRFGQLMFNVGRVMKVHGRELFYMEEDDLLKYIKNMFDYEEEK